MKRRSVVVAVLVIVLGTAGFGAASWALASEHETESDLGDLNSEKLAMLEAERQFDEANAAAAADPTRMQEIAKDKASEHQRHLAELRALEEPTAAWPTGIFDDPEASAPGIVFIGSNRWVGKIGQDFLAVHAGRSGEDPTVGRVLTVWSTAAHLSYSLDLAGVGALRVIEAVGSLVTVQDERGGVHLLDAAEGKWVG